MPKSLFRVDLQRLILWMCLFFTFLALGNSLYAAYKVQHDLLLRHSMDLNRVHAEKLAQVANSFLKSSAQALEMAVLDITDSGSDPAVTQKELEQLDTSSASFSAVIAVDQSGQIVGVVPKQAFASGAQLPTLSWQLLATQETATISGPFIGPAGRWLSVIAHPMFSSDGSYAGFIGGTVNLQSDSALQKVLNKSHYQDGSYFYIVDEKGTVVYHPNESFIGASFKNTQPVLALLGGKSGTERLNDVNDQLVSFAPISFAKWGIVVQRPTQEALSNLDKLFFRTFYYSLPLFVLSLLAIWWLARFIAHPLRALAEVAANLDDRRNFSRIRFIKGWYLEAALIRRGLLRGFSAVATRIRKLHREGSTDPLTGLLNRRGLDAAITTLTETAQNVAAITIDIDHFKRVNDKYGHAAGDKLLKSIAAATLAEVRTQDVVARTGGEEFVILLPDTELDSAAHFAERLRSVIEKTRFGVAGNTTISLGVAGYPQHGVNVQACLLAADAALYRAKAAGRNRVHLA